MEPSENEGRSTARTGPVGGSSRDSLAGAGWTCREAGEFKGFVTSGSFYWIRFSPIWKSRNQVLSALLGDPTNNERRCWMEAQREEGKLEGDPIISKKDLGEFSFLVVGDTGEGDASQYAAALPMMEVGEDTEFMVIMSDVIYPAGDTNEYEAKFYRPYKKYAKPIYAIPGNHDWYDGLHGFMYHLCDSGEHQPEHAPASPGVSWWKEKLRRRLWRMPEKMDPTVPARKEVWRPKESQKSEQCSPYFAIEAGPIVIVCIDTGMNGDIDCEQGEWLRKISKCGKPKVLLTGKPIYVDGEYHPGPIEGGGTVDEVVRDPENNYVASIGGDVHNYQRYTVKMVDGRLLRYIVSGGGGAYMSATHKIPRVSLPGIEEIPPDNKNAEDKELKNPFVCYPRRGDSLSFYSKLYDSWFSWGRGRFELSPDEAAAYMEGRLGITPARAGGAYVGKRARRVAERIFPLPGRGRGPLHHLFSEIFDWNDPPLFKNFLRLDVSQSELRLRCFAATGCLDHERDPPVEDDVKIKLKSRPSGQASRD